MTIEDVKLIPKKIKGQEESLYKNLINKSDKSGFFIKISKAKRPMIYDVEIKNMQIFMLNRIFEEILSLKVQIANSIDSFKIEVESPINTDFDKVIFHIIYNLMSNFMSRIKNLK